MQDFATAYASYAYITSDFPSVLDNNGYPYIYYAILNLLDINVFDSTINMDSEIGSFMEGMNQGTVPMNSSTSDILSRISAWKAHSGMIDSTLNTQWDESASKVERTLRFFNIYSNL